MIPQKSSLRISAELVDEKRVCSIIGDVRETLTTKSASFTVEELEILLSTKEIYPDTKEPLEILFRSLRAQFAKFLNQNCDCRQIVKELDRYCERVLRLWGSSRTRILRISKPFLEKCKGVLVHGHSETLCEAVCDATHNSNFKVYFTQCTPLNLGGLSGKYLGTRNSSTRQTQCHVIHDVSVWSFLSEVQCVVLAANAVTPQGGCMCSTGASQVATLAACAKVDVYVIAETFRFTELSPISLHDEQIYSSSCGDHTVSRPLEYVDPSNITLYFTDVGVFQPSSMADEVRNAFCGKFHPTND